VRLLLTLLEKSCAVYGAGEMETAQAVPVKGGKGAPAAPPPQESVKTTEKVMKEVFKFRHVCEKALLHLLSSPDSGMAAPCHNHWAACYASVLDWEAMRSTLNLAEGEEASNVSVILNLIKNSDEDISNRGIRLLSIAMHSASAATEEERVDALAILEGLGLDAVVVKNLSDVLLLRVSAASKEIDDQTALSGGAVAEEEAPVSPDEGGVDEVKEGEGEVTSESVEEVTEVREAGVVQISLLSAQEVLALALCCLKPFLDAQADHVNAFASGDQINGLASLLYRCGPVVGPYLYDGGSSSRAVESIVHLLDPRSYGWDLSIDSSQPVADEVIVREIVLDVLTSVADADGKYREYGTDAELPQQAGVQFPESTSVCAEQSMHVFRLCSNPCVATLMCRSTFKLDGDHINAAPSSQYCSKDTDALCQPVCDAALRLLIATGSAGVRGIAALYTAVNQKAFEKEPDSIASSVPAMGHLKDFFCHKVLSTQPVDGEQEDGAQESQTLESIDAPVVWKLPEFCELDMVEGRSPTHYLQVLRRKDLWPYMTVSGALLGLLANPQTDANTMNLAIQAVYSLCRVSNIQNEIQPAVVDTFGGCLLGMGGGVILGGCLGRFGPLMQNDGAREVLSYLIDRGQTRELFWKEWAEAHPPEVDAGAGKAGKKDAKKDAKAAAPAGKKDVKKGGAPVAAAEVEIVLPFLPDDSHPDPNHGPDAATWRSLINVCCDDLHGSAMKSHPLIACIQGGMSETAIQLIAAGALVNQGDEGGVAPLQHTLVLGDESVSAALVEAGADVDYLDSAGNEAVKYAFFSLEGNTLSDVLDFCRNNRHADSNAKQMALLGRTRFVPQLIAAGVDLDVCDSIDGNYPLHHALGVGQLSYVIGGVSLMIRSSEHIEDKEISTALIEQLVEGGAPISAVNHNSVAPLHILAALGDVNAVTMALKLGATPNVIDNMGYMPIHYAVASCSAHCIATVDVLLKKSVLRPSCRPPFDNIRTGKTVDEKYEIDSKKVLDAALLEASCPQAVKHRRLTQNDILNARSDDGVSVLMMSLCGSVLGTAPHHRVLVSNPTSSSETRVRVFCYLSNLYDGCASDLMKTGENDKITPAQAFALMLAQEGLMNGSESSESLFNAIWNIADQCFGYESYSGDTVCSLPVLNLSLPKDWITLHAAILSNSESFLNHVWEHGVTLYKFPFVHFVAGNPALSESVMSSVVMRAALTPVHGALLNAALTVYPTQPIHIATKYRNVEFLKCLCALQQCDPNVVDKEGRTAIHVACLADDADLVNLFLDYSDSVDVLQKDNDGETCVDAAIKNKSVSVLGALLQAKRIQVVEKLLAVDDACPTGESLLMRLEKDNMHLCGLLGITAPVEEAVSPLPDEGDSEEAVVAVEISLSSSPNEEEEVYEAYETSGAVIVSPPVTYENPEEELNKSNALLQEVILLLQELNMADADVHAHKCFYDAVLYKDFCRQGQKEEPVVNESGEGLEGAMGSLVLTGEEERDYGVDAEEVIGKEVAGEDV
jgi:ankyrin repeat protein